MPHFLLGIMCKKITTETVLNLNS